MIRTKNNTSAITEVIAKNPPKKANNSFIFDPSEIKMMSNSPEKKFCSVDYKARKLLRNFSVIIHRYQCLVHSSLVVG